MIATTRSIFRYCCREIVLLVPLFLLVLVLEKDVKVAMAFQSSPPVLSSSSHYHLYQQKITYHEEASASTTTSTCRSASSFASLSRTRLYSSSSTEQQQQQQQQQQLSEMDARVLKSMLQDNEKLDLQTEENLKKLLERGVVSKEIPEQSKTKMKSKIEISDSEFSSQMLQTLSDTKLWRAISRKAGDWLESAKIYVVNRVERDAMTLAALGAFAWDRAVRDVGRALPAAGDSSSGSSNSNFGNKRKGPFLLSSKSSANVEDMITPMDEIKSVGSAVADIFKTGGKDVTDPNARVSSTGVLRTAATSRQDKRNFQRAYQRSKEKQRVQQQNKNPIRATQRAASGVVDTAWQLQRELKAESNVPGYKTKQVQNALEAASDSTKQLLQGAQETWKLERAKQRELRRQLRGEVVEGDEEQYVNNELTSAKAEDYIDPDASFFTTTAKPRDNSQQEHVHARRQQEQALGQDVEQLMKEAEAELREERIQAEREQQEKLRRQQQQAFQEEQRLGRQETFQTMEAQLLNECNRLKDQLQNCIVNPEQTWLRSDIIEGVLDFDQTLIRQVVTEMIATRNSLKELVNNKDFENAETRQQKIAQMLEILVAVEGMIEEMQQHAQQAVSLGAARALKEELLEKRTANNSNTSKSSDSLIPILLRLDELQNQFESLLLKEAQADSIAESELEFDDIPNSSVDDYFYSSMTDVEDEEFLTAHGTSEHQSPKESEATATKPEFVDVVPEAFVYAMATTPVAANVLSETDTESAKAPTEVVSSMAELVTDYDFEAAVGETKRVVAMNQGEEGNAVDDAAEKDDNLVFTVLLRSLDIIFFLLEKTITVAIPTIVTSGTTAKGRLDNVAQGGLGSKGWKRIGNAQEGARRY